MNVKRLFFVIVLGLLNSTAQAQDESNACNFNDVPMGAIGLATLELISKPLLKISMGKNYDAFSASNDQALESIAAMRSTPKGSSGAVKTYLDTIEAAIYNYVGVKKDNSPAITTKVGERTYECITPIDLDPQYIKIQLLLDPRFATKQPDEIEDAIAVIVKHTYAVKWKFEADEDFMKPDKKQFKYWAEFDSILVSGSGS
jgi:hypothetical protein